MVKRALLVGCNYPGTQAALNGCVNDVMGAYAMLTNSFGFDESEITIMIDTDPAYTKPTGGNIKQRLTELVGASQYGDVLVFHFSGHGTQIPCRLPGTEEDGKDEAICPCDMNVIIDDDLRRILHPLAEGVKFTMIADCCHSGTMLDGKQVVIAGDKASARAPASPDVLEMFGMKGVDLDGDGGSRDLQVSNKSLPVEVLCQILAQTSGKPVNPNNLHSALSSTFGPEASAMISSVAAQMLHHLQNTQGNAGPEGGCGCFMGLLGILAGPPAKPQGQAYIVQAPAAPQQYAGGGGGWQQQQQQQYNHMPGQKPPADAQLGEEKGILITGCQSFETSADACPGGDKTKAYGALSNAIQTIVRQRQGARLSNRELVTRVREVLHTTRFAQNPCLECSHRNAEDAFIC